MNIKSFSLIALCCVVFSTACNNAGNSSDTQSNTVKLHKFVTDGAKCQMLDSMETLDTNRLYRLDYTVDYKLDEVLDAQPSNAMELYSVLGRNLFDVLPEDGALPYGSGCSAYVARLQGTDNYIMGRNFDFCHAEAGKELPTTAIVLFTSPEGGKKSISIVDAYWLLLKQGFYTDENADISTLMFAPYVIMDGINEDGLAVCDLFLDGKPADQNDPDKKNIFVTVAMRAVLDKCGNVNEAVDFLKGCNIKMAGAVRGSLHFMLADASGDYAVVEWTFSDPANAATSVPDVFKVLKGEDVYRYMTNFYIDPALKDCEYGGLSKHGRDRYNVLKANMESYNYILSDVRAKALLESVSQSPNPAEPTSHTQWSALYNMNERTLELAILQEYGKWYKFSL